MATDQNGPQRTAGWMFGLLGMAAVSACASTAEAPTSSANVLTDNRLGDSVSREPVVPGSNEPLNKSQITPEDLTDRSSGIQVPSVSRTELSGAELPEASQGGPQPTNATVDAVVPALPIPQFIDVVFGDMLGVPYTTGPGVAERTELVQLRSSGKMEAGDFLELVSRSLENYGIMVSPVDGAYQIVTDASLQSKMPRFIKSRSRADIPEDLRPVVQFIELDAVSANEMEAILRQAFPDKQALKIETNPRLNVLTLTGMPRDLDAALSIINQLDELAYAGSRAERYSPVFWSATQLANEVSNLLEAEGWQASTTKAVQKPILIMPVEYSNDIFIFSRSPAGLSRARFWLSELDRPTKKGNESQVYVYDVQNVDAKILSEVVSSVILGQSTRSDAGPVMAAASGAATDPRGEPGSVAPGATARGNIVVNTLSNQIIYTGTASQYDLIYPLLQRLDQPTSEVLIEMTIAEVTLTDDTRYGVEFFIDSLGNSEFSGSLGNEGLGLGANGTTIAFFSGNVDAALNLFAKNNLVDVLSTPRIMARSGGSAQIQVGQDVPIITSQRAADSQDGTGDTDILQSVDYRSTGVLLSIEPIVFSDNRIDLSITQEVSTAVQTTTSEIASPTISNRSITTQLSLEDGKTAILGGLIQETVTRDETGAPILKDIPVVGNLFRNTTLSSTRTELIVLITAYVMRDGRDKEVFTEELLDRFSRTSAESTNLTTYVGEPGAE